ncbi:MAG: 5'-methylthioadenosine/S-adenosylhomocysteine nucleosidase [Coriobacteriia bacterium]|nr:5'-methylthioadenosine/S-adenosylhomocysteine nucleosidase [Coriobacteriia bacterium]
MDETGRVCVLCAMKTEAKPFIEALEQATVTRLGRLQVYEGLLDGRKLVLACKAVGVKKATAAAEALLERFNPACLVMSGTAGGIDSRLQIGDTVVAAETVFHDRADTTVFAADEGLLTHCHEGLAKDPPQHTVHFGRIATGKAYVVKGQRASIIERLDPLCVDMESAAVAEVCKARDIPFIAVRSISDTEANAGFIVFFKNALQVSRHSFAVVRTLLQAHV